MPTLARRWRRVDDQEFGSFTAEECHAQHTVVRFPFGHYGKAADGACPFHSWCPRNACAMLKELGLRAPICRSPNISYTASFLANATSHVTPQVVEDRVFAGLVVAAVGSGPT